MSTWVGDSNLKDDSLLRSQKLFLLLFLSAAITLLPLEQVTQATQGKKFNIFIQMQAYGQGQQVYTQRF